MRVQKIIIRGGFTYMAFVFMLSITGPVVGVEQETLLSFLMDADAGEIKHEMAELLRSYCMHELQAKKVLQSFELCFMKERSTSRDELYVGPSRVKTPEVRNAVCPQVKHILEDCLRGKNLILPVTGERRDLDTWYTKYFGSLESSSRRRELAEKSGEQLAEKSGEQLAGKSGEQSAEKSGEQSAEKSGEQSTKKSGEQSTKNSGEQFAEKSGEQSAKESGEQSDPLTTIIIAVGVTAFVTFIVSVLLFYLCCANGLTAGRNDERPLLSLSLSDNSVASSQRSSGLGTPGNEEKPGSQSFKSNLKHTLDSRLLSGGNIHLESKNYQRSHSEMENEADFLRKTLSLSNSENSVKENPLETSADDAAISAETCAQVVPGVVGTPIFPPLKPPPGRVVPPSPPPVSSAPSTSPAPPPPSSGIASAPSGPPPPGPPPSPALSEDGPRPPGPPPPPGPSGPPSPGPPPPPPIAAGPRAPGPPPRPGVVGPRAPGPPPPPGAAGPRAPGPPPPPGAAGPRPPGPPPPGGVRPPKGAHGPSSSVGDLNLGVNKAKLKPFFWDKVNASTDDSMVWNQIKAGSFQFNEEMIETLFGCAPTGKNAVPKKKESDQDTPKFIQIIDPKKAQNLSIMLKALSVTTQEVIDALEEGNELPAELIQTLLKMAPTSEEELKLRLFTGELTQLGPAERFLKVVVDIPFAYKRLETIYFMGILEEESTILKDNFVILEAACLELRKSRLFLKLLEAVLKTGNRMNSGTYRGGAQAFKLDTLLKLVDVKGIDGKTTLLHFVVLEIIRGEGIRAARSARELKSVSSFTSDDLIDDPVLESDDNLRNLGLQAVSGLGVGLENVKKAAALDVDNITGSVVKLGHALVKSRDFLHTDLKGVEKDRGFVATLRGFVEKAGAEVRWLLEEEKRITALIKSTVDYFHGSTAKDEGFRLFTIVRDFLVILDKVCLEVKSTPVKPKEKPKENKPHTEDEKSSVSTVKEDPVAAPRDPQKPTPRTGPRLKLPATSNKYSDSSDESDSSD